jgi:hypothetical protein
LTSDTDPQLFEDLSTRAGGEVIADVSSF